MSDLTLHAKRYAHRGFRVMPLDGRRKPIMKWGPLREYALDAGEIETRFGDPAVRGIGLICGRPSGGLAVRDYDRQSAYDEWAGRHPDLARLLPTVATRRGRHVYCRAPEEAFADCGDGEYRADAKHFVVAPPSERTSGPPYRWLVDLPPDGELPLIEDPVEAGLVPAPLPHSNSGHSLIRAELLCPCVDDDLGLTQEELEQVRLAIQRTLPATEGRRNQCIFELCRQLQGIPKLRHVDPHHLEWVIREWHRLALPAVRTKSFDVSRGDFLHGWQNVEHPAGEGPLDAALAAAVAAPLPPEAGRYEDPRVRLLVGLCAELQRRAGTQPFFLGCRAAGRLLGVDHKLAAGLLRLLVDDGVLAVVAEHTLARAREYRYRRR